MKKRVYLLLLSLCLLIGAGAAVAAQTQSGTDLGDLTVTGVVLPGNGRLEISFRLPEGVKAASGDTAAITVLDGDTVLADCTVPVHQRSGGVYLAAAELAETDLEGKTVTLTLKCTGGYYDTAVPVTIPGNSTALDDKDVGDLNITSIVLPVHYGRREYGKLNVYYRLPEGASLVTGTDTYTVTVMEGDTVISEGSGTVKMSATSGVYYAASDLLDTTVNVAGKTVTATLCVTKAADGTYYDAIASKTIPVRNDGFVEVAKEYTLAEVKPRYGIEKLVVSDNLSGQNAAYRNGMDAYTAHIAYISDGVTASVSLAESFAASSADYATARVEFTCAVGSGDTPIHTNPGLINLQVSTNGTTYTNSGVTFTAEKTGEVMTYPGSSVQYPIYRFTSGNISLSALGTLKNIRLQPSTAASAKGTFRLLSLYVWGDTGEFIEVPTLDGNLNPTVEKTTADGVTSYKLYDTDFSDFYSWRTNVTKVGQSTVNYKNATHAYTYLTMSQTSIMDGSTVRIYSPDMVLDTSLYDSILVEYAYFRLTTDPAFAMKLGYSTDNGATWQYFSASPTIVNVPESGDGVKNLSATTRKATLDLKKVLPQDEVITNIVILPYYNKALFTMLSGTKVYNTAMTSGGFRLLEFSITGTSASDSVAAKPVPVYQDDYDSIVIQGMIDEAAAAGETEVIIPRFNPRDASNTWVINDTIKVPSNMTLYISDCTLVPQEYTYKNLITNTVARVKGMSTAKANKNVHIIGMGDAVIRGGIPNGLTSSVVTGSGRSMLDNILILLHNVDGFSIQNLRIEEARFWAVAMMYCVNGEVAHMDYYASRVVPEQDGVDIRNGCSNITIHDITGRTGDDSTAINAINPYSLGVSGRGNHSHDITIYDVFTRLVDLRMQVRLTCNSGYQIYNVDISNIRDATMDFDPYQTFADGGWATASVRIGDNKYGTTNTGDIYDITIRNVTAYSYAAVDTYDKNHVTIGTIGSGCHAEYDAATVVNEAAGLTGPDGRLGELLRYGTH